MEKFEFKLIIESPSDSKAFNKIWKLITKYGIYHGDECIDILNLIVKNKYIYGIQEKLIASGRAQTEGVLNSAIRNNCLELVEAIFEIDTDFKVHPDSIEEAKQRGYNEMLKLLKDKEVI